VKPYIHLLPAVLLQLCEARTDQIDREGHRSRLSGANCPVNTFVGIQVGEMEALRGEVAKWAMNHSSKVNLPRAIDFRVLCGAHLATYPAESRGNETLVLHQVEGSARIILWGVFRWGRWRRCGGRWRGSRRRSRPQTPKSIGQFAPDNYRLRWPSMSI